MSILIELRFLPGFTKANSAGNYYFWLLGLEPTIQETKANQNRGPAQGCRSIEFRNLEFSYPLAPHSRVLKGVSLTVRFCNVRRYFTVKLIVITQSTD